MLNKRFDEASYLYQRALSLCVEEKRIVERLMYRAKYEALISRCKSYFSELKRLVSLKKWLVDERWNRCKKLVESKSTKEKASSPEPKKESAFRPKSFGVERKVGLREMALGVFSEKIRALFVTDGESLETFSVTPVGDGVYRVSAGFRVHVFLNGWESVVCKGLFKRDSSGSWEEVDSKCEAGGARLP